MTQHATPEYVCPICLAIRGIESEQTLILQQDILYKDAIVMVFTSSFFIHGSEGHVIVVPVAHYENLYVLPDEIGAKIFIVAKKFATKMKQAYRCDGVNVLQNNEPAAGQHALHYHLHLFPRYQGDDLWSHMGDKRLANKAERLQFVRKFF
ncbi:MAG: hypothetical protein A3J60_01445 [Candidatus Pacebacteria bacterium RIFCSPHIGHO2_02_FULL_46_9]|nr:MAG: hypothetical protein A3J60_01445 [Candidatus Pacebacteria bacterium RIFCSPHIGHO2_02_FULL_46_9]